MFDVAGSIDGILGFAGFEVRKAKKDILSPAGFDAAVIDVLSDIKKAAGPEMEAGLTDAIRLLERRWPGMSDAQKEKAFNAAADKYATIGATIGPLILEPLRKAGEGIMVDTKKANISRHAFSILPTFDLPDEEAIHYLVGSQANYVRDRFGVRREGWSETARQIVARGLSQGHDSYVIGEKLDEQLRKTEADRTESYWRLIASVFVARSRSWSAMRSFEEAGITAYQLSAVLDSRTSTVCRFMHGRVFPVAGALATMRDVDSAEDPEAVTQKQPWPYTAKLPDGGQGIFFKSGGSPQPLSRVLESGAGKDNVTGKYSPVSQARLSSAGIQSPPFHGRCRTLQIPVFGQTALQVPEQIGPGGRPDFLPPPPPAKVLPYVGGPTVPVVVPSKLPENLADLVRPVPAGVAPDEPGSFGEVPAASQDALLKKKAEELAKLIQSLPSVYEWDKSASFAATPIKKLVDESGKEIALSSLTPQAKKLGPSIAAAKKKPTQEIPIDLIHADNYSTKALAFSKLRVLDQLAGDIPAPGTPVLIKFGGKYHVATNKYGSGGAHADPRDAGEATTLAFYSGKSTISAHVIDLDAKAKKASKKKAPEVPADPAFGAPPPAVKAAKPLPVSEKFLTESVVLAQKDGEARGSNEGGFYTGSDGVKRYVKFYREPSQAYGENLANGVYRELGIAAPSSGTFVAGNKVAYASDLFDGGKTLKEAGLTKERAREFLRGFVGDVLTGNWDAVGLVHDNALVLPNGQIARIDNGGTFLYRAQGGQKPGSLLNQITEWDKLFDPQTNPAYTKVLKAAGYSGVDDPEFSKVVRAGIRDVLETEKRVGGWATYVTKMAPSMAPADSNRVAEMLTARTRLLEKKLADLEAPKPQPAKGKVFDPGQLTTHIPEVGTTFDRLPRIQRSEFLKLQEHRDRMEAQGRLPTGEKHDDFKRRTRIEMEKLTDDMHDAIQDYTGAGYGDIRRFDMGKVKFGDYMYESLERKSNEITFAFDQAKHEPATAYRGMHGYSHDLERVLIDQAASGKGWGFGEKGNGAATSASWDINIARSFSHVGTGWTDPAGNPQMKVIYKIKTKTTLAVETISSEPEERELLIGKNARFRTTGMGILEGTQRVLIIEAEEI